MEMDSKKQWFNGNDNNSGDGSDVKMGSRDGPSYLLPVCKIRLYVQ